MFNQFLLAFLAYFLFINFFFASKFLNLFSLFCFFNLNFIFNAIPIYVISFFCINLMLITGTLSSGEIFLPFANPFIWQIVFILLISKAVMKTNLINKLYEILFFKNEYKILHLAFFLNFLNFCITFFMPSNLSKTLTILLPLINNFSITKEQRNFLLLNCLFVNTSLNSVFATSFTNVLIKSILAKYSVVISYFECFLNSIFPSLICCISIPFLTMFFLKLKNETIVISKKTTNLNLKDYYVLFCIVFFIFGNFFLNNLLLTSAITLLFLLCINIFNFEEDIIRNKDIWSLFLWFSTFNLIIKEMLLQNVHQEVICYLKNHSPFVLFLIYSYSHYFFTSLIVHATTFFEIFFNLLNEINNCPKSNGLILLNLSNIFGGLTYYTSIESFVISNETTLSKRQLFKICFGITTYILLVFLLFYCFKR